MAVDSSFDKAVDGPPILSDHSHDVPLARYLSPHRQCMHENLPTDGTYMILALSSFTDPQPYVHVASKYRSACKHAMAPIQFCFHSRFF